MSDTGRRLPKRVGSLEHPLLALFALGGAVTTVVGLFLLLSADPTLGRQVGFVGGTLLLYGATGYLAFAAFERAFE